MKFLVRKDFNINNLFGMPVSAEAGSYLESDDKYILINGLPVFSVTSDMAKTYCIWADDGQEDLRLMYESVIVFNPRMKEWKIQVPSYDDEGNLIGYESRTVMGRFSPDEIDYMKKNFSQFLAKGQVFRFNDFFYIGSDIKDISNLYKYINR